MSISSDFLLKLVANIWQRYGQKFGGTCFTAVVVQDVMKWLSKSEDRLQKMSPTAADIRPVRIQLEELKARSITNTTISAAFRLMFEIRINH